ncbi:MAG: hypothetical protein Athens041674_821 [Parcubacteria group bacterium Athens0416_74]|nr:MAG: hypothetical protein Athens041674_821 [Parcubacteria group bacterium Athens0416_74]
MKPRSNLVFHLITNLLRLIRYETGLISTHEAAGAREESIFYISIRCDYFRMNRCELFIRFTMIDAHEHVVSVLDSGGIDALDTFPLYTSRIQSPALQSHVAILARAANIKASP